VVSFSSIPQAGGQLNSHNLDYSYTKYDDVTLDFIGSWVRKEHILEVAYRI
jgi:hypothetical protein